MISDRTGIACKISRLKEERDAVVLAHYYASPEVQDIADFLGDSLGLSRKAAASDASVIVFCGVHFMAETAALICPGKKVLSPAPDAGCSLADSIDAAALKGWRKDHPEGIVVSYVNTTAAVKAYTDYCCTSANAIEVVKSLPEDREILFGPDRNLGAYIRKVTGRDITLWNGVCTVHEEITAGMVRDALSRYPDAEVLIHPEARCSSDNALMEDSRVFFYSTSGMVRHAAGSAAERFIVATEEDTLHQLKKECPGKVFIPVSPGIICSGMKKVTLENVLDCLENGTGEVIVPEEIRERALLPIMRMME